MTSSRADHPMRHFAELSMRYGQGWVALVLVLAVGAYSVFFIPWFIGQNEPLLVGKALPDTLLWYSPDRLFSMAESYGEAGRAQYILGAFTFDLVFPLVYGATLIALAGWLSRPFRQSNMRIVYLLLALPILTIAFDFLENASVTAVMALSPAHPAALALIAAIATPCKWLGLATSGLAQVFTILLRAANAFSKALRPA